MEFTKSQRKLESPQKSRTISAPSSPFLPNPRSLTSSQLGSQKREEDARIIQRTLVYIINLPSSVSDELTIASPLYFSKYGSILKVHITPGHHNTIDPTYGAYLTYSNEEDAAVCIRACHEFVLDGKKLCVTFGTTKYCTYFLKGTKCPKAECVFLHSRASEADTIYREDMINTRHIQAQDSIFDRLKVVITAPVPPSKLPDVRIIRDRAVSEIVEIKAAVPYRQRIYSGSSAVNSRYQFTMEGDDHSVEVPKFCKRLQELTKPCKEISIIPLKDMEEIMDPLSPVKWFVDVMEVTPEDQSYAVIGRKHRSSL